ncbi:NlpC/P60 family protein [Apibacter raozihei]|uniref:C40 family peptidase n=1 Tax=Apibacter TaxID=1778601 RepID=UPI000FE3EB62|nr:MULTISPECIES: NlpC/P60 family protein [Apibacter]
MKKNIVAALIIMLFLVLACKSKYYREVPYKLVYSQQEIDNKFHIKTRTLPILDTLDVDEDTLTDREIYLKEKYAIVLGIKPKELKNYKFYDFIDQWIGTPYAKVGFTADSLNIAAFISALYQYTYKRKLPTTPLGIFKSNEISLFTGRKFLKEGDLLFFRYAKDMPVGDIGIYLRNNRILYSTKKNGLMIGDFNENYYQLRYVSAGRLIIDQETEPK